MDEWLEGSQGIIRMGKLILRILAIVLRRLTNTVNVTWDRWILYVPLAVILLGLEGIATIYFSRPSWGIRYAFLYLLTVEAVMVLCSGIAVFVMEITRDRTGSIAHALEALPLSKFEISIISHVSSVLLGVCVIILPIPPVFALLVGLGYSFLDAFHFIACSLSAGVISIAVPYILVSIIDYRHEWRELRFPVVLIFWVVYLGWQARSVSRNLTDDVDPPFWLPASRVISESLQGTVSGFTRFTMPVFGLLFGAIMLLLFFKADVGENNSTIVVEWQGHGFRGYLLGDFSYVVRNSSIKANCLTVCVMNIVIAMCVQLSSVAMRRQIVSVAVPVVMILSATIGRCVRAVFPRRNPPQKLLNMNPAIWVLSLNCVTTVLCATLALPACYMAYSVLPSSGATVMIVSYLSIAISLAVLLGFAFPVASNNVFGQGLMSIMSVVALGLIYYVLYTFLRNNIYQTYVISVISILISFSSAFAIESLRWNSTAIPIKSRNSTRILEGEIK